MCDRRGVLVGLPPAIFLSAITPAAALQGNPPPGNPIDLGTLGGPTSDAFGVSADGTVVVGQAENGTWTHAFRWTAAGGMVDLGDMAGAGGGNSFAYGVNADGTVVVGNTDTGNGSFAFRWTQAGMISLGAFPNGAGSNANAVNADGTVVVGQAHDGNFNRAFRWTPGGGMFDLGTLPGVYVFGHRRQRRRIDRRRGVGRRHRQSSEARLSLDSRHRHDHPGHTEWRR